MRRALHLNVENQAEIIGLLDRGNARNGGSFQDTAGQQAEAEPLPHQGQLQAGAADGGKARGGIGQDGGRGRGSNAFNPLTSRGR